jgi:hypothetical protein
VIDLHLHSTASDGRLSPTDLVDTVAAAGVRVMAVTDHDTTAGVDEVRTRAAHHRIDVVPGIEITAVEEGRDIHVLGYFLEPGDARLEAFLRSQRASRVTRVEEIAARLDMLGMPIDLETVLAEVPQGSGRAVGRPQVARAMIRAGYVADVQEAFTRWLATDCPAFVPRQGPPPERVIDIVHELGGVASLAHPGRTQIDDRIDGLRRAGLDALEAFHSDHTPVEQLRYARLALHTGMLLTGGSDFHADPNRPVRPASATLPEEHWPALAAARLRYA